MKKRKHEMIDIEILKKRKRFKTVEIEENREDRYIPAPDGSNQRIKYPSRQGEEISIIDYDDPWETRRIHTDDWGNQTVINHDIGQ